MENNNYNENDPRIATAEEINEALATGNPVGMAGERKVLISSKIPAELEARIKRIADKETRTVSNTIHILLESHPLLIDAKKETALAE